MVCSHMSIGTSTAQMTSTMPLHWRGTLHAWQTANLSCTHCANRQALTPRTIYTGRSPAENMRLCHYISDLGS